ncbi:MAG: ABC transporter ATP-binding protein [Synergistaceae bacterium]|nr:ABC transporter ATP-binding protein [Synergistaceae bacterium]
MLLEVRNLKKEYSRGGGVFPAVDDVCLSIGTEDFVCITGPSGSGKSTLLSMIAGLLAPSSGSIVFDKLELVNMDDDELSLLRNTKIGYIPQGASVLSNLSVLDNVILPFYLHKKRVKDDDPIERANGLLARMGILKLAETFPPQLSGGELRRTAIARSLINSPLLLIADEPTVDLDPKNSSEVMSIFRDISKDGTAVILVSHDIGTARGGNRFFFMESGRLEEKTSEVRPETGFLSPALARG